MGVAPRACLVVEDSVAGVSAARAAGMTVLGFIGGTHVGDAHERELREVGAAEIFDDMILLPALAAHWTQLAQTGSP